MAVTPDVELALLVLYRDVLPPDELDLNQLGTPAEADVYRNAETGTSMNALKDAVDFDLRRDRYAAALAYTLAIRRSLLPPPPAPDPPLPDIELQIEELGAAILAAYDAADTGEESLRNAVTRVLGSPGVTTDVCDDLMTAFAGSLGVTDNGDGTFTFTGDAAEFATMLTELACCSVGCEAVPGFVTDQAGVRRKVLKLRFEVCTSLPFVRCMTSVDPRNWDDANHAFFQSIEVIDGFAPTNGSWHGTIQEKVTAPLSANPVITTNLLVSYLEQPNLAVTTYDLSSDATLKADDGTVNVDYGFFAVTDEGKHRRITVLKVASVAGMEDMPPGFLCPLWLQQLGMVGWWF